MSRLICVVLKNKDGLRGMDAKFLIMFMGILQNVIQVFIDENSFNALPNEQDDRLRKLIRKVL